MPSSDAALSSSVSSSSRFLCAFRLRRCTSSTLVITSSWILVNASFSASALNCGCQSFAYSVSIVLSGCENIVGHLPSFSSPTHVWYTLMPPP